MKKKEKSQSLRQPADDFEIQARRTGTAERNHKERQLNRWKEMLGAHHPEEHIGDDRRWVIRSEWEKPDPSTVWRGAAGVAVAIAAAAMLTAITVPRVNVPKISFPWAIGIGAVVVAAICLFAHYDVNRGRKAKRAEIVEEHPGQERTRVG